jgi:hypothetical protein
MSSAAEPQPQAQLVSKTISTATEIDPLIRWDTAEMLVVAADRSLRSALCRVGKVPAPRIVIVRSDDTGVTITPTAGMN